MRISAAGVRVNLATGVGTGGSAAGDTFIEIENLAGSIYADRLTGDAGANRLSGGAGDDVLAGGAGADLLQGAKVSTWQDHAGSLGSRHRRARWQRGQRRRCGR